MVRSAEFAAAAVVVPIDEVAPRVVRRVDVDDVDAAAPSLWRVAQMLEDVDVIARIEVMRACGARALAQAR